MNPIRIDNAADERLADYAGVRAPALLRDRRLLIAEGRFVVRRLLHARRLRVRSLLLNEAACLGLGDALDRADPSVPIYVASPDVITAVTGFNMHRGCLALAERPEDLSMAAQLPACRFVTVLERVVDPDNVGSVFRTAEAFGVDLMLLSPGCADPLYRKAIRTSSGAALVVPFVQASPWPQALDELRAAGFSTVALTPDEDSLEIGAFAGTAGAQGRVAVIFGNEGHGLSADVLARSDVRVRIPMCAPRGGVADGLDSLNIATAAGIALHRLDDARRGGVSGAGAADRYTYGGR